MTDAAPPSGTLCDPRAMLADTAVLALDPGSDAHLIGVTPDELTVAWSSDGSGGTRYQVADRISIEEGFAPATLVVTDNIVVGLSPDGLRLVTLSPDRHSYQELTRDSRGYDFGPASDAAFALINAATGSDLLAYADAVISASDDTLIYTVLTQANEEYPTRISTREPGKPWPVGRPLESCALQRHGALIRHPSALSADGLTLFFFDPDLGHARAAWRHGVTDDFSFFVELVGVGAAAVNASCNALYYSGPRANSDTLMSASRVSAPAP